MQHAHAVPVPLAETALANLLVSAADGVPATGTSTLALGKVVFNGNRLSGDGSTYAISINNSRITSISGALTRTYGYDAAGNTTSYASNTFAYDDSGRMVSATVSGTTSHPNARPSS